MLMLHKPDRVHLAEGTEKMPICFRSARPPRDIEAAVQFSAGYRHFPLAAHASSYTEFGLRRKKV